MLVRSAGNRLYTPVDDVDAKEETAALSAQKSSARPMRSTLSASDTSDEALSRTKRGPALSKDAGLAPFRRFRGGDALSSSAWSYYRFDQADYAAKTGPNGICQGWIRLALSRLDNSGATDLTDAVRRIQGDMNNHRGFVSEDTFASARHLQVSTDTLRLQRYVPTESMQMSGSGVGHLRTLFDSARRNLEVGGVAHIALGLNPRGTNTGTTGHVLLLQRLPRERYALFDPNNGVMTYSNRRAMEAGLRRYMDESFRDTGMQLTPDSVQYYAFSPTSGQMAGPSGSREAPDRPQARPEPPLTPSAQGESPARDALASRCDQSNSLSIDMLSGAAGQREAMSGMDRGVAAAALRDIAQGHAPNLTDATENVRRGLADPARRQMTLNRVFDLQQQNGAGVVEPLPGYARRRGAAGMASAANLIGDLRQHFGSLHVNDNMGAGYPTDLAIIDLSMSRQPQGNPDHANARTDSVPIVVQRLHEMDDFEGDQYELYDPGSGVYRYNTFGEMADALRGVFDVGFRPLGGVDHADTTYYANLARPVAATGGPAHPPASSVISNLDLAGVERRLGIINARPGVTPSPGLPPPPFVIEPKQELKRSAPFSPTLKPDGLFRPSMLSPVRLKGHGGFDSERTPVSDINLSIHNLDVASHPRLVDSAGYLGTFRKEKTALERLPGDAAIGYIYFVAPTPNMVDVAGSLGREEHAPENGEVAAMGWIDYPQIRGWRAVKNGVPGKYVANPDYRWDVYDQTRMAGSQPQLSRLPINNDVWREEGFKASVSRVGNAYGKEREALQFNEDPNLTHALFYDAAWEKVRELNRRQSEGLDYRGPLRLRAYGAADRSKTEIYVDPDNNVQVNTLNSRSSWKKGTRRNFSFADDGRFHLIDDYNKVLRVGSNDYLYLGDVPDAASLNGVFEYDGKHLIHQEDLRLLTTGLSSYTPFVDNDTHGERSEWHLRTSGGREVTPPRVNLHTFRSQTSGNPQQLYAFYQDPDMALPSGVTRFVTRVPNNPFGGKFLDYVGRITDEEARNAADFLRKQNAAWLFDDGFYAVAKGPDVMEVSRLDGTPVWRAEGVNVEPNRISTVTFKPLLPLSSNYRMADETKKRVEAREDRRRDVIALLTQSKSTPASRTTV